jgi:hypothetical protein
MDGTLRLLDPGKTLVFSNKRTYVREVSSSLRVFVNNGDNPQSTAATNYIFMGIGPCTDDSGNSPNSYAKTSVAAFSTCESQCTGDQACEGFKYFWAPSGTPDCVIYGALVTSAGTPGGWTFTSGTGGYITTGSTSSGSICMKKNGGAYDFMGGGNCHDSGGNSPPAYSKSPIDMNVMQTDLSCRAQCASDSNCLAYKFTWYKSGQAGATECVIYGTAVTSGNTPTGWTFASGTGGTITTGSATTVAVCFKNWRSAQAATFETDGGILHGSWNVESSLITSDRRLKTNIMPLQRTLRDVIAPKTERSLKEVTLRTNQGGQFGLPSGTQSRQSASGDGALWLLRQLRPVSYSFRKGVDAKNMRFGFIADELENVVPEVVRRPGDREVSQQKAVVYQDLIALLFAGSQSQQGVIDRNQKRIVDLADRLTKYEEEMKEEEEIARKVRSFKRWKAKRLGYLKTTTTTMLNTGNLTSMLWNNATNST